MRDRVKKKKGLVANAVISDKRLPFARRCYPRRDEPCLPWLIIDSARPHSTGNIARSRIRVHHPDRSAISVNARSFDRIDWTACRGFNKIPGGSARLPEHRLVLRVTNVSAIPRSNEFIQRESMARVAVTDSRSTTGKRYSYRIRVIEIRYMFMRQTEKMAARNDSISSILEYSRNDTPPTCRLLSP